MRSFAAPPSRGTTRSSCPPARAPAPCATSTGSSPAGRGPGPAGRRTAPSPPRTYELTEFPPRRARRRGTSGRRSRHSVTYHPTCHSLRLLGVGDRPERLLRHVRGLRLLELPAAESAGGFGGTFAMKNAETSVAMGSDKARHAVGTGAEVLVASDKLVPHAPGRPAVPRARRDAGHAPGRESSPAPRTGRRRCSPRPTLLERTSVPRARRGRGRDRHLRGDAAVPQARARRRSRTRSCGPTCGTRPTPSATSGPPSSTRSRTGRRCAAPVPASRTRCWRTSTSTSCASRSS